MTTAASGPAPSPAVAPWPLRPSFLASLTRANVLSSLTTTQHISAVAFGGFLVVHLAAPSAAAVAPSGRVREWGTKAMILGRVAYQTSLAEPVLVYGTATLHLVASLLKRAVLFFWTTEVVPPPPLPSRRSSLVDAVALGRSPTPPPLALQYAEEHAEPKGTGTAASANREDGQGPDAPATATATTMPTVTGVTTTGVPSTVATTTANAPSHGSDAHQQDQRQQRLPQAANANSTATHSSSASSSSERSTHSRSIRFALPESPRRRRRLDSASSLPGAQPVVVLHLRGEKTPPRPSSPRVSLLGGRGASVFEPYHGQDDDDEDVFSSASSSLSSPASRWDKLQAKARRWSAWLSASLPSAHTASGLLLMPWLLQHVRLNRLVPARESTPIRSLGPSELTYDYVAHGLVARPWTTSLAYAGLLVSAAYHVASGTDVIARRVRIKARARRRRERREQLQEARTRRRRQRALVAAAAGDKAGGATASNVDGQATPRRGAVALPPLPPLPPPSSPTPSILSTNSAASEASSSATTKSRATPRRSLGITSWFGHARDSSASASAASHDDDGGEAATASASTTTTMTRAMVERRKRRQRYATAAVSLAGSAWFGVALLRVGLEHYGAGAAAAAAATPAGAEGGGASSPSPSASASREARALRAAGAWMFRRYEACYALVAPWSWCAAPTPPAGLA